MTEISTKAVSNASNKVMINSVNEDEVKKFNGVEWWNEQSGSMKPLISMNKLRVPFVRDGILASAPSSGIQDFELAGFKILDIGCGGGILSEGLGRVGATVVGIDPGTKNIAIANQHLPVEMKSRVSYECTTAEMYASQHPDCSFDAVVMSEVIEHVENPKELISVAIKLLKPQGSLFITTPNRTIISWIGVILMAEYVLRILPVGTHEWQKFLTPGEVEGMIKTNGMNIKTLKGITYNPITNVWGWTPIKQVQYAIHAVKN